MRPFTPGFYFSGLSAGDESQQQRQRLSELIQHPPITKEVLISQSIEELRTLVMQGKGDSPEFKMKLETLALLMIFQRVDDLAKASPPAPSPPPVFHDYLWPVMMLFFGGIIKFGLDWVLPQKKKAEEAKPDTFKPAQGAS